MVLALHISSSEVSISVREHSVHSPLFITLPLFLIFNGSEYFLPVLGDYTSHNGTGL